MYFYPRLRRDEFRYTKGSSMFLDMFLIVVSHLRLIIMLLIYYPMTFLLNQLPSPTSHNAQPATMPCELATTPNQPQCPTRQNAQPAQCPTSHNAQPATTPNQPQSPTSHNAQLATAPNQPQCPTSHNAQPATMPNQPQSPTSHNTQPATMPNQPQTPHRLDWMRSRDV